MSLRITELVNCKYTGRSHLECNHHKLIGYRVGTLSMCSQCIHNVPGGCTDPCPQCEECPQPDDKGQPTPILECYRPWRFLSSCPSTVGPLPSSVRLPGQLLDGCHGSLLCAPIPPMTT